MVTTASRHIKPPPSIRQLKHRPTRQMTALSEPVLHVAKATRSDLAALASDASRDPGFASTTALANGQQHALMHQRAHGLVGHSQRSSRCEQLDVKVHDAACYQQAGQPIAAANRDTRHQWPRTRPNRLMVGITGVLPDLSKDTPGTTRGGAGEEWVGGEGRRRATPQRPSSWPATSRARGRTPRGVPPSWVCDGSRAQGAPPLRCHVGGVA